MIVSQITCSRWQISLVETRKFSDLRSIVTYNWFYLFLQRSQGVVNGFLAEMYSVKCLMRHKVSKCSEKCELFLEHKALSAVISICYYDYFLFFFLTVSKNLNLVTDLTVGYLTDNCFTTTLLCTTLLVTMCSKSSTLKLPSNLKTLFSQNGRNADTALWL